MFKLFLSHGPADEAVARELGQALAARVQVVTRLQLGADPPWAQVQQAIESADGCALVVSADFMRSNWAGMELRHALRVQGQRGEAAYPVLPLSLDGARLGPAELFFDVAPRYLALAAGGGLAGAAQAIVAALSRQP